MTNTINMTTLQQLGLAPAPASGAATGSNSLGQNDFLTLMLAQMQNQDPLQPMDNGQFLSQMAQFSTATGIQNLQSSFGTLSNALTSNQALQAAGLVGRQVLVPAQQGTLPASGGLNGAVNLTTSTPDLAVNIYDASGALVRHLDLGTQAAGLVSFHWDGLTDNGQTAAPGTYQISAAALVGGQAQAADTLLASTVQGVTLGQGGQGVTLNLAGQGSVDLSSVREIM